MGIVRTIYCQSCRKRGTISQSNLYSSRLTERTESQINIAHTQNNTINAAARYQMALPPMQALPGSTGWHKQ